MKEEGKILDNLKNILEEMVHFLESYTPSLGRLFGLVSLINKKFYVVVLLLFQKGGL